MLRSALVLLTGLLALPVSPLTAQEAASAAPAQAAELTEDALVQLDPEVQHALVFSVGMPRLYQKLQALLIDSELKRRTEAGLDTSYSKVTPLDVEQRIERTIGEFVDANPDLDFWTQVTAAGYTEKSYREEVSRNLQLERLYFPPNTDDWPVDMLKEVFGDETDPESLWSTMISKMPEELKKQKENGQSGEINALTMKIFLRPNIFRYLMDKSEIKYPFDGLSEGVCLSVDGLEVKTEDLLRQIASIVSETDLERAQTWVNITRALRADLQERGVLMTREETAALMDEERKEYVNSYISYEQIALEFMGFPSMELYSEYKRLRHSFRKTLPDPMPEEVLDAHLADRLLFIGAGQVTAEVILISAKDLDTGIWPKTGAWDAAKARLEVAVKQLMSENGANWSLVLDQYSEYPEKTRGAAEGMPQPKRGRFGSQMRNPLRQFVGENDFTDFLFGDSVADHLFFEAEPGAIYGPTKGPYGYYIYKLVERSEPTQQPDWRNNERHNYFVRDDYLNMKFMEYIAEQMSR